ncbi:MAG: xylulokinase [Rectinema sp.]|jgi:xylulokinase
MLQEELLLAIDIGSSSCKAAVFTPTGKCLADTKTAVAITSIEESTGKREYDPDTWITAAAKSVRKLTRTTGDLHGRISAVGLSGQIGTHIVLSEDGKPACPAISWQDGRARQEAFDLSRQYPGFGLDELIGMHLPPGTAWPIPRLLWVKANAPELLDSKSTWIQPKDYLFRYLTGELVTDYLSLRGLVHPKRHAVDSEIKDKILGIPDIEAHLPVAKEAWGVGGQLRTGAARALGVDPGIPVVIGSGDFHCAVLGSGELDARTGFNVSGTSDHIGVLVSAEASSIKSEVLGRYPSLIVGNDILYGATSSSGGMLEWFVTMLGSRKKNETFGEYLDRELRGEVISKGILCLPYLNGERAPLWDADARAIFAGMGSGHTRADMLVAILEGVAFSLRNNAEIIESLGLKTNKFRVSGASALSKSWNQIKANVLKTDIALLGSHEVSCLGASMLAAVGVGFYADTATAASAMSHEIAVIEPDVSMYGYYDELFGCFKQEYDANRSIYKSLSRIREL